MRGDAGGGGGGGGGFFFFNDTATTEIYTLSLHDALPIFLYPNEIQGFDHYGLCSLAFNSGYPALPEIDSLRLGRIMVRYPWEPAIALRE